VTHRRAFRVRVLSVACVGIIMAAAWPAGIAHADNAQPSYPYSCNRDSLTADFAARDTLPQTRVPPADWYQTDDDGRYVNRGWGPAADALPAPEIPSNAGCDTSTWKQERVLAVAMRYINAPDNPLGLQYRHHHIPGWNPTTSTYAGASAENSDVDAPDKTIEWAAGPGLDCSNFTAWVYDYGLGIKFSGDVHQQFAGTAGPMGQAIPREGPFEPGDLIFLHPNGNSNEVSHVVIFMDDQHIIDSRVDAQNLVGVQIRNREGWYRTAILSAYRPIG
jgi:cell wall-associated NlpC family hydrolase